MHQHKTKSAYSMIFKVHDIVSPKTILKSTKKCIFVIKGINNKKMKIKK